MTMTKRELLKICDVRAVLNFCNVSIDGSEVAVAVAEYKPY